MKEYPLIFGSYVHYQMEENNFMIYIFILQSAHDNLANDLKRVNDAKKKERF